MLAEINESKISMQYQKEMIRENMQDKESVMNRLRAKFFILVIVTFMYAILCCRRSNGAYILTTL